MELTNIHDLADFIIVIMGFSAIGIGWGYFIYQIFDLIIDGVHTIKEKRKQKKEAKADMPKPEQES